MTISGAEKIPYDPSGWLTIVTIWFAPPSMPVSLTLQVLVRRKEIIWVKGLGTYENKISAGEYAALRNSYAYDNIKIVFLLNNTI